jgi:hypothetical protein
MPPCRERAGASCLAIIWSRATLCWPKRLPWKPTSGVRWRRRTNLRLDKLASQPTSRDYRRRLCKNKPLCPIILLRSGTHCHVGRESSARSERARLSFDANSGSPSTERMALSKVRFQARTGIHLLTKSSYQLDPKRKSTSHSRGECSIGRHGCSTRRPSLANAK